VDEGWALLVTGVAKGAPELAAVRDTTGLSSPSILTGVTGGGRNACVFAAESVLVGPMCGWGVDDMVRIGPPAGQGRLAGGGVQRVRPVLPGATWERDDGQVRRLIQRISATRWFAAFARRLVPLDRWVFQRAGGRFSVLGAGWLVPTLVLTTTGRRSGRPRHQPLVYIRDGDDFVVIGSNWGQDHHPAWSTNLLANPDASVLVDGRHVQVRAELVAGEQRQAMLARFVNLWPAYRAYVARASGRDIRHFRLTPRP
jgi:deazaflavin-dependent oxidoreductase (nitroreductase family)